MAQPYPLPKLNAKDRDRRNLTLAATVAKIAGGMLLGIVLTLALLVFLAPGPQPVPTRSTAVPDLTITVSDNYIARAASTALSRAQLPVAIGNVRAQTAPGNQLTFSGNAQVFFGLAQPSLSATSQLEATGGHLAVHITRANLGGLPLPSLATSAMEGTIDAQLASTMSALTPPGQHYLVTGVTTGSQQVTIDLAQQP